LTRAAAHLSAKARKQYHARHALGKNTNLPDFISAFPLNDLLLAQF
jgi:hypothetical protein